MAAVSRFDPFTSSIDDLFRGLLVRPTRLGLDLPIAQQYVGYMLGLLRGDLGRSFLDGSPVMDNIAQRLPRTL